MIELNNKNEQALEYVIDKYSAIVNGVVRKVLLPLENVGLIEECIYDVFLSVWNNIEKFKGDKDKFKNWIAGISKYKAIDYYRKYNNEKYKFHDIDNYVVKDNTSLENEIIQLEGLNHGVIGSADGSDIIVSFDYEDLKFMEKINNKLEIIINKVDLYNEGNWDFTID